MNDNATCVHVELQELGVESDKSGDVYGLKF